MHGSRIAESSLKSSVPGPGQYHPNTKSVLCSISYGYTFGGRTSSNGKGNDVPPPGSYQIQSTIDKKHVARFGMAKRGELDNREAAKIPGPGAYGIVNARSGPKFG
eukprot:TRINITY_DN8431_c0_g2_i8.p3 TRINITY_DN8431_c0_g2~~TRINITY_DN8431_c0_g2_i8.p3  ORF type:complete len:106 (+),score=18.32 TRINITY_DN8431_c0_g2_i8:181-498(+)